MNNTIVRLRLSGWSILAISVELGASITDVCTVLYEGGYHEQF